MRILEILKFEQKKSWLKQAWIYQEFVEYCASVADNSSMHVCLMFS